MTSLARPVRAIGRGSLAMFDEAGGIALLLGRVARSIVPSRLDGRALVRSMYRMGNRSLPIVALTAFFTGGIMVIQAGIFVRRYGAHGIVGWGTGYATLREVGPILIALMFSGRVGANNAAELANMTVTEQIHGLRSLALDPVPLLVAPRVVAMMVALFFLTAIGDLVALCGAALCAHAILGVEYATFYHSFADELALADLASGLIKALAFGLAIALTSCHFGLRARGGAVGVGRAVNNAVVSAALGVVLLDFLITFLLR